jgi:hypothetical protein
MEINMETFTQFVTSNQFRDYRINPRNRDLNCEIGYERTTEEIDCAGQEVLEICMTEAGSWALMFNEPQFRF